MPVTRRGFMRGAASSFAIVVPGLESPIPLTIRADADLERQGELAGETQLWDWQVWMNNLGPRYTGNPAHTAYVDFLASHLESFGLNVARDRYVFPRWEAGRYGLTITPKLGRAAEIQVTSYYPYSGETPRGGVTGELVYAGQSPKFDLSQDFRGKIVFIDCPGSPVPNSEWYSVWGAYRSGTQFPSSTHNAVDQQYVAPLLADFQRAGAVGTILGWTDISDAQAEFQYIPFSKPHQNIPALWVGRAAGNRLRGLAGTGATATLTLEGTITQDAPTESLIATLPGISDEIIIVNTHTDGPNATEENGGIAVLALAKFFASQPKSERKRTLVFVLATGHFAHAYVPSIDGIIAKHPEIVKNAVAALAIEHLGAREWMDDPSARYRPTGKDELSLVITAQKPAADIMLTGLEGGGDRRAVVVRPKTTRFIGEGGALYRAGIPTIGYIPVPSYLLAGPPNGHIDKLDRRLLSSQVRIFAKVIHQMDTMSAAELKGG